MEGSPDCWANHWYNPPHSPRTVPIQSEKKGWQNHSGPLTSSTLTLLSVTVWSTLQSRGLHWVWAPAGPNANPAGAGSFTFAAGGSGWSENFADDPRVTVGFGMYSKWIQCTNLRRKLKRLFTWQKQSKASQTSGNNSQLSLKKMGKS